jgi:alpha-2-macroglobulin
MGFKCTLHCIPFLLLSLTVCAQAEPTWQQIEAAILQKNKLQFVREQVLHKQQQALQANDPVSMGRSYYYLLAIADATTEDSLFFKNAHFLDSILNNPRSPALLKAIVHMLQAKRITQFKTRFFYRHNKQLIKSYHPVHNYSTMSREGLDSLSNIHYTAALQLSLPLPVKKAENLLWLSHDPYTFLFKPDFTDLIYAEQIASLQQTNYLTPVTWVPAWLTLSQDDFMQLPDTGQGFTVKGQEIFRYYKQWMQYHAQQRSDARYYIETLARKYFYNQLQTDTANKKAYERYLQTLLQSSRSPVKAHAVYQLCLLWNSEAANYNPIVDRYNLYFPATHSFDSSYRLHYEKTLTLFARHEKLLDSFSFMKDILLMMKAKIEMPGLVIDLHDKQLPNEPIPAMVKYRNTPLLFIRIIKIRPEEILQADRKKLLTRFLTSPAYRETVQQLPFTADHQWHNTFLKIDALPAGNYLVLYADSAITAGTKKVDFVPVTVTQIAVINNDSRVFVLNRKTGFPLQGAAARFYRKKNGQQGIDKDTLVFSPSKTVNQNGYLVSATGTSSFVQVCYEGDTLMAHTNEPDVDLPKDVYDKEEYEDRMEYYEDQTRLHIFTDRAIYRPGQTVHYKGIFITRHPKTGEPLVLNWKNLHLPFFKKLYYRILIKLSGQKIEIDINDPFGRVADSIRVIPNKYGSFAGSFVIPKDAATGQWDFDLLDADMADENQAGFKVEEYKRPSFELTLEKPVKELYLGDSFSVKTRVKSLAGALLNNTSVKYSVSVSGYTPSACKSDRTSLRNETICTGSTQTNDKGELLIAVSDSALQQYDYNDDQQYNLTYTITATAVDATGESHEETLDCLLTNRPVSINAPIPTVVDRSSLHPLYISTTSSFAGPVKKPVRVRIYKKAAPQEKNFTNVWPKTDVWLYPKEQLKQWFLGLQIEEVIDTPETLVYETSLQAGGEDKLLLPASLLINGYYRMTVTCRENGKITGETARTFSVFDKTARSLPAPTNSFHYLPTKSAEKGQTIQWITGNTEKDIFSIYHLAYYTKNNKGFAAHYEYDIKPEKKGLNQWQYTLPLQVIGDVKITHLYIFDNQLYQQEETIFVPAANTDNPEIVLEQYRRKLTPGAKETFTVSVKTRNENTVAELMTTMYDASLDKLEEHEWTLPRFNRRYNLQNNWNNSITQKISGAVRDEVMSDWNYHPAPRRSLWWLNLSDYTSDTAAFHAGFEDFSRVRRSLSGSMPGISVMDTKGLSEVVVVGYGYNTLAALKTTSYITIRGTNSLNSFKNMLVVIDGVPYEGDISKIDANTITGAAVLKGMEASALYGARAANGVLIVSTKGALQLPFLQESAPPPVIRKNFAETAFFYPQVHIDHNGYYTIHFTLPESVTSWKWKMLAHTKKAGFAYAEKTIVSQLPLMVQPDMPRFLYQGDKLIFKSRISNLDSLSLSGILRCTIEDAVTGEDISTRLLNNSQQHFSVAQTSNTSGSFVLTIPATLLHPLKIKVTATTSTFSDGEEHIIPVLAKKILVSRQMPITLHNAHEITIPTPDLPADAEVYGLSLYITPKPQAALVNALPYLANYPYHCAEQTFNKLLAHAIAVNIVRTDTNAQQAWQQKTIALKGPAAHEKLPDELSEQTMPWLQLNHAHIIQQSRLSKLLDTFDSNRQIRKYLNELKDMQDSDGGITWFKGGKSNAYISAYILAGFGKLRKDRLLLTLKTQSTDLTGLITHLIKYCDGSFGENDTWHSVLPYLYARSFWLKEHPLPDFLTNQADSLLTAYWQKVHERNIGCQALLITTTLRFYGKGTALHHKAMQQLESIRQLAIHDEVNGIRWKDISDADDLTMQTEEWVVKIAEAFEEAGTEQATVKGIIQWLLQTRDQHNWSTTKATADAATLLNRHQPATTGTPLQLKTAVNNTNLQVSDDLFRGQLATFSEQAGQAFPGMVIKSTGAGHISGGINYYYFTADPPEQETGSTVNISKALFRYNATTTQWESLTDKTVLAIADKIKTVITIHATRPLQYVFIDEKRAAALEPAEAFSGYQYDNGLAYYRSVRDAGYQFFAEKIPSGITSISYETVVAKQGAFTNGPVSLQCMYQPSVKAFGKSTSINVQ